MYGHIIVNYKVSCGKCHKHKSLWGGETPLLSSAYVKRHLRDEGWRESKKHGWLCPDCQQRGKA